MITFILFRIAFWLLVALVFALRVYFRFSQHVVGFQQHALNK